MPWLGRPPGLRRTGGERTRLSSSSWGWGTPTRTPSIPAVLCATSCPWHGARCRGHCLPPRGGGPWHMLVAPTSCTDTWRGLTLPRWQRGWFQAASVEVREREHPKRAAAPLAAARWLRPCEHLGVCTAAPPPQCLPSTPDPSVAGREVPQHPPSRAGRDRREPVPLRGGPKGAPRYRPALAPLHPTRVRGDGGRSHREQ